MEIYLVITFTLIIFSIIEQTSFTNKNYIINVIFCFCVIILVVFSGVRYNTGADQTWYIKNYNNILNGLPSNAHFENGFLFINKICVWMNLDCRGFFIVLAILTICPIAYVIYKESHYKMLSLLLYVNLYFYYGSFNLVRQYLAISIVFLATWFMYKKNNMALFTILVIAASTIHSSAIVMMMLVFVPLIKLRPKMKIILLSVGTIICILGERLLQIVVTIIPKYSTYIGYERGSAISDCIFIVFTITIMDFVIRKDARVISKKNNFYYNMGWGALFFALLTTSNVLMARFESFFYIYCIISIPNALYRLKNENKLLVYALCVVLSSVICVRYLVNNNCGIVPYIFNTGC